MQTLIIIVSQLVLFGPNQDTLTFFGTDENWEPKKYDQIWEVLCFTARKPGWNHIILLHPFSCASKSLELECGVWKSSEAFPQPVAATLRASPKCVQTSWILTFDFLPSPIKKERSCHTHGFGLLFSGLDGHWVVSFAIINSSRLSLRQDCSVESILEAFGWAVETARGGRFATFQAVEGGQAQG